MVHMDWQWLIWLAMGYLCGSVPFGLLIGFARGVDIREAGSGNIGATNASRVLGRKWGVICFVLDVLKGWAPVFIAGGVMGALNKASLSPQEAWIWLAVGAVAVIGHVFPIWLGLRGGKGVATGFGVLLGFWPILTWPALAALLVWVAMAIAVRYVSLASMVAAVSLPIWVVVFAMSSGRTIADHWPFIAATAAMAILVLIRHRTNLVRLCKGTESKIGDKTT